MYIQLKPTFLVHYLLEAFHLLCDLGRNDVEGGGDNHKHSTVDLILPSWVSDVARGIRCDRRGWIKLRGEKNQPI